MSNQHVLKIHPAPLADLMSGAKTAEVRRKDRDFQVGDTVRLMEVNPDTGNWTGAADQVCTITHIQTGYGLPDDMCVLSYGKVGHDYKAHWMGFMDRTDWMQEKGQVPAKYLGQHRADILTDMLREAREALARLEAERDSARITVDLWKEQYDSVVRCGNDLLAERDTAQREALARVEAEHATWMEQYDSVVRYGNELLAERDTAQAQLAEAVGLLKYVKDWFGYGDLPESLNKLDAFLTRHAQAEVDGPDFGDGPEFEGWSARAGIVQAEQQEAQGAQAGDERAAFESSLDPSLSRETFVDEEGDTVYCDIWVQGAWIGWSRRAALATQPRARC